MTYHNTTHVTGQELARYRGGAQRQQDQVLQFFSQQRRMMTPSQVWDLLFARKIPLTSVRRAITDLTKEGKLVKTDRTFRGPYGRPEYGWKYAVEEQQELF